MCIAQSTSGAALGGTLTINVVNGFTPTSGKMFDILHACSSIMSKFSTVNGPSNIGLVYDKTHVLLKVN
jgi:hypothetical protein